jgi:hypothetical protein
MRGRMAGAKRDKSAPETSRQALVRESLANPSTALFFRWRNVKLLDVGGVVLSRQACKSFLAGGGSTSGCERRLQASRYKVRAESCREAWHVRPLDVASWRDHACHRKALGHHRSLPRNPSLGVRAGREKTLLHCRLHVHLSWGDHRLHLVDWSPKGHHRVRVCVLPRAASVLGAATEAVRCVGVRAVAPVVAVHPVPMTSAPLTPVAGMPIRRPTPALAPIVARERLLGAGDSRERRR